MEVKVFDVPLVRIKVKVSLKLCDSAAAQSYQIAYLIKDEIRVSQPESHSIFELIRLLVVWLRIPTGQLYCRQRR
jgi:hypothetical protein